jgi:chitin synthase
MDVGTRPGPHSIYKLWAPFDKYRDIGGACGEVRAITGKGGVYLLNPLVAEQNFEDLQHFGLKALLLLSMFNLFN